MSIEKPRTNIDTIIRFFLKGDITLNAEQEELWLRLIFTDGLIRSRKYGRDIIIDQIKKRFEVSIWRANQDITDAHKVFGETRKLNKVYLISHHIEEIGLQIQMMKETRRFELLPKLNDNYTYALNSIPRDAEETETPPVRLVFVFNGAPPVEDKSLTSCLSELDNYIKNKNVGDYIPFEESGTRPKGDNYKSQLATDGGGAGKG